MARRGNFEQQGEFPFELGYRKFILIVMFRRQQLALGVCGICHQTRQQIYRNRFIRIETVKEANGRLAPEDTAAFIRIAAAISLEQDPFFSKDYCKLCKK